MKKGGAQTGHNISRKKKKGSTLEKELKKMEKEGILLRIHGEPSNYREIAKAHIVAENGCYMRDYIQDQEGGIAEIDFHYVNKDQGRS